MAKNFIKYWLPVVFYAIFIFQFSGKPGQDIPSLFPYQDVVFHIVEYAVFGLLLNRAMKHTYSVLSPQRRAVAVFFIAFCYAVSDEWHQSFVPARTASVLDLAWDGIGITIANILYRWQKLNLSKQ